MSTGIERSQFSKNLITQRKLHGVSQRDLSKLTGISTRMIAHYETHAVIPPLDKLDALSKALNISVAELLDSTKTDETVQNLNTRTLKKIQLLEQLPPEDQKKVLDHIKDLIAKNKSNTVKQ